MRILFLISALILGMHGVNKAQFDPDYFRSPVDIPIALSGNFGEIRSGHFHAGLDIKTQGREGLPIYASADGYISRIKISLYGYGKALYITHPNGYTTVYAHLQQFEGEIEKYVRKSQYFSKTFEIELFPAANELKVTKGQRIALSGNTGGSGGPHLHFEVRETKSEIPVNPMLFQFPIQDRTPPVAKNLAIYPLNEQSSVNGLNEALYLPLVLRNGQYEVNSTQAITVHGKIGFGIEAVDYVDGSPNYCGVYSVSLYKNNVAVYRHQMQKLGFHESRYVQAHVDYFGWKKLNKKIQRSFLLPNNKLTIYDDVVNNGNLFFITDTTTQLQYEVSDVAGNKAIVKFTVNSTSSLNLKKLPRTPNGKLMEYDAENYVQNEWFTVQIPPYTFYENTYLNTGIRTHQKAYVSPIFDIADLYTPAQTYYNLSVNLDSLADYPPNKLLIVALDEKDQVLAAEGGVAKEGWLNVQTRSFGPYAVMIDTTPPVLKPKTTDYLNSAMISFEGSDNLSGIKTYSLEVDGKWLLLEYERKTNTLFYKKDEYWPTDGKALKLTAADSRGNVATLNVKLR